MNREANLPEQDGDVKHPPEIELQYAIVEDNSYGRNEKINNRQTDRQTGRQMDRRTDRQTDRQTD